MAWVDQRLRRNGVQDLVERLIGFSLGEHRFAFRGTTQDWPTLTHSLYRLVEESHAEDEFEKLPGNERRSKLADCEQRLWDGFVTRMTGRYPIRLAPFINDTKPTQRLLEFAQHFGCPTRMLDWSLSPWFAAFCATLGDDTKDGRIWWFDIKRLREKNIQKVTDSVGSRLEVDRAIQRDDLDHYIFNPGETSWVLPLISSGPFSRMARQQGMFTISNHIERDHATLIETTMCPDDYGRLIIPGAIKAEMRRVLGSMNYHAEVLEYPLADMIGREQRELVSHIIADQTLLPE